MMPGKTSCTKRRGYFNKPPISSCAPIKLLVILHSKVLMRLSSWNTWDIYAAWLGFFCLFVLNVSKRANPKVRVRVRAGYRRTVSFFWISLGSQDVHRPFIARTVLLTTVQRVCKENHRFRVNSLHSPLVTSLNMSVPHCQRNGHHFTDV